MVDKRFTDFDPPQTPSESDIYPLVQSNRNRKQTLAQLRAAIGAAVSSLVGLTSSANKIPYYTAPDTLALTDFTAQARGLLDDTSFRAMMDTLNSDAAVTLASAATVSLNTAASRFVTISGTTAITSFGTGNAGATREVTFSGALTLTHNGTTLILPGAANITTAVGDMATVISLGGANWRVYDYVRANGKPIAFAYDRSNVIAAVAQTGGVPTGGLIEYGTNANGWYEKYAGGLLICGRDSLTMPAVTVATGSLFGAVTDGVLWTFPLPFVSAPHHLSGYDASYNIWVTPGAASTTNCVLKSWCATSTAGTRPIRALAIGRWF